MDIESGEVKLILDENGHCIDVKKRTSGESEACLLYTSPRSSGTKFSRAWRSTAKRRNLPLT